MSTIDIKALIGGVMFFDVFVLAFSLGIDAFFVALGLSMAAKKGYKNTLIFSGLAGFFQFFMPVLGFFMTYFLSMSYLSFIQSIDHFLVFIVFVYLAYKLYSEEVSSQNQSITFLSFIVLAFATSIDALGAGLMIFSMGYGIWQSAIFIGIVTLCMCFCSLLVGYFFKGLNPKILKIVGACLLLFLGIKALFSHIVEGI